jgi:D-alanyl-D-alanine carboxypeptidase
MIRLTIVVAGLMAGCNVAPDSNPDAADPSAGTLADILQPIQSREALPALAGAVWRGNSMIASGVAGVRKLGDLTPATVDDEWHLGSDGKAMTATLLGIYVDRHRVSFDDTLGTLFAGETIAPGYSQVTLLQLLQHIGGSPAEFPADIWAQMLRDGNSPTARMTAVRALLARGPAQAPGTFVYSNAGYVIAGAALERVVGNTWEQMMRADLFAPLGMTSCGFGAPGDANAIDEPWGHQLVNGGLVPVSPATPTSDNPPSMGPAGSVHCSLADWGRFFTVHLAGARGEPTSLVSSSTMTQLQTPPTGSDYACGWIIDDTQPWAGGIALTHGGSNTLWYADLWLAPAKNLAFAVVTNDGSDGVGDIANTAVLSLIEKYAN